MQVDFDYSKYADSFEMHFGDVGEYRFTLMTTDWTINRVTFVPRPLPSKKKNLESLVYKEYNRLIDLAK